MVLFTTVRILFGLVPAVVEQHQLKNERTT